MMVAATRKIIGGVFALLASLLVIAGLFPTIAMAQSSDEATLTADAGAAVVAQADSPADIANANLSVTVGTAKLADGTTVKAVRYTGNPVEPQVTGSIFVSFAGFSLTQGKDFVVTYSNNIQPGTATAHVKGIGDYTGSQDVTFEIVAVEPQWDAYGVYGGQYAYFVDSAWESDDGLVDSKIVRFDGVVVMDLPVGGAFKESFPHIDYDSSEGTSLSADLECGFISLKSKDTGKWGVKKLDGTLVVPFKYDFLVHANKGLAGFSGSWHDATSAGIDYYGLDGALLASVSRSYPGKTVTYTYYRYGDASYLYDQLNVTLDDGSDLMVVEKNGSSYQDRSDLDKAPERTYDTSGDGEYDMFAEGFWNKESFVMEDGTVVKYAHDVVKDEATGRYSGSVSVTDADKAPIVRNGHRLTVAMSGLQRAVSGNLGAYYVGVMNALRNSVKHGNVDVWWAVDEATGLYGAVDSTGAVVVPFEYDEYADRGLADTDYALGKKDGEWVFLKVVPDIEPVGEDKMHRLYNPYSGEHFYTSDEAEYKNVKAAGWNDEGFGWTAPSWSHTPVYRLYNKYGGEHHYCMDKGERDMLIAAGWNDEGIGWYSDDAKTVPLYREYNPNAFANNHNYTTNQDEHKYLVSIGWKDEGYAWYGI